MQIEIVRRTAPATLLRSPLPDFDDDWLVYLPIASHAYVEIAPPYAPAHSLMSYYLKAKRDKTYWRVTYLMTTEVT